MFKCICLAIVAATAIQARAQEFRYSVTLIDPLPGHSTVSTNAMNNQGDVVGVSYGSPINNQAPYIYHPALGVQALPLPPGYAFSVPTDITDDGVIVGYAQPTWLAEQSMVAWKLENGQFTMYPGVSFGNNINNHDVIVGRGCLSGTQLTCYFQAAPGGAMQTIGPSNFYSSTQWRLIDINDYGQIAYTAPSPGLAKFRAVDGTLTSLPGPTPPYVRTYTWALNNAAQVIARWEYNVGSQYFSQAFIWQPGSSAQIIGIPNLHIRPKGLNGLGHVVGESGGNQDSFLDMWLWTPQHGNENLDPLIDPTRQIVTTGVSGINDRGQIIAVGIQQTPPVQTIHFILTSIAPGDVNGDMNTDLFDWSAITGCLSGPSVPFGDGCATADLQLDNDVDLRDAALFQQDLVGP